MGTLSEVNKAREKLIKELHLENNNDISFGIGRPYGTYVLNVYMHTKPGIKIPTSIDGIRIVRSFIGEVKPE